MKKTHSKRLSIPCFFQEPKPSSNPTNPAHKQSSTKTSPNNSYVSKMKLIPSKLKSSSSRQQSPRPIVSCTNSPPRATKPKVPSHVIKKKKKLGKKPQKIEEKLSVLSGENLKFAPKIFENQLFLDVYDEFGRHDRLMEIQESLASERNTPVVVFNNLVVNEVEYEGLKPPGNSFEDTCQDSGNIKKTKMGLDLFARLEQMAREQCSLDE